MLNWGILGGSNFALKHMAPAIQLARGARLAAVASQAAERAAPFAALAPGVAVHGDYDALLADPGVDAVYIPLANADHVDWALRANAAGKHVLCEKPLAMHAGQIDRLIAARQASGLELAEAFMIVHHPQWRQVRDWIAAGEIGRLRHVDVHFTFDNPDPANIRNRPETGGGAARDIGIYAWGAVIWATGALPAPLAAECEMEAGIDATTFMRAGFVGPEGPAAAFSYHALISMRLFGRQEVVFQGAGGLIRLRAPFNPGVFAEAEIELHRPDAPVSVLRYPGVNQYVRQVEAFDAAVEGRAPFPWGLEDSRRVQGVTDRVLSA
ncbi:Gfo/Idh/MocA family protein [Phaeovulum vinaykumarii]|uniref:Predicted dehydrogenase n=1 Tax=Phaeovulum vinaykumarii TaxID=407234 RepID=A0A1N7JTS7_9RHOB|nr:Gfo/Idh/MocA family oxidoreductase [Phaeovulum vinaykumarii]SIS52748.1 Predicted dehydrogenase [Phaeovulum vinaykumarii]SOB91354.1 predicted dehydrogenase [Phaeovulum vinaykumarii]